MATALRQSALREVKTNSRRAGVLSVEEVRIFERWRPNILITGAPQRAADVVDDLDFALRSPVARWSPGEPFVLPLSETTRTVVVTQPAFMSADEQQQLLEWIRGNAGVAQIITITSIPLFELVARDAFSSALYYYLNVVHLELGF